MRVVRSTTLKCFWLRAQSALRWSNGVAGPTARAIEYGQVYGLEAPTALATGAGALRWSNGVAGPTARAIEYGQVYGLDAPTAPATGAGALRWSNGVAGPTARAIEYGQVYDSETPTVAATGAGALRGTHDILESLARGVSLCQDSGRNGIAGLGVAVSRFVRAGLGAVLGVGLVACGGDGDGATEGLLALERLAFVPAGPSILPAEAYDSAELQLLRDVSLGRALVVDRFEVTRRDCQGIGVGPQLDESSTDSGSLGEGGGFVTDAAVVSAERLDWPAYLTFAEAMEVAARRGMRLPTPKEWVFIATGGEGVGLRYPYHWGTPQKGYANTLGLGLGRPAPVGSFENGKGRFGCYDLHGNVWEWVAGVVPGHTDLPNLVLAVSASGSSSEDGLASAMGGSYQSTSRRTYGHYGVLPLTFHSKLLDTRELAPDVGARLVADAGAYLLARRDTWGDDEESMERLRAVGLAWADAAGRERVQSFLEDLLRDGLDGDEEAKSSAGLLAILEGARGPAVDE
ncbi:MAG: hypothetical protein ACI9K5_002010 [Gammaproteobacteria bacterium]